MRPAMSLGHPRRSRSPWTTSPPPLTRWCAAIQQLSPVPMPWPFCSILAQVPKAMAMPNWLLSFGVLRADLGGVPGSQGPGVRPHAHHEGHRGGVLTPLVTTLPPERSHAPHWIGFHIPTRASAAVRPGQDGIRADRSATGRGLRNRCLRTGIRWHAHTGRVRPRGFDLERQTL